VHDRPPATEVLHVPTNEPALIRRAAIQQGDRELRRTAFRFAEDFRELRLRTGVSQRAVGHAIGVDPSVITRIERADPTVGPAIRARACAVLGADFRMQLYRERAALIYDAAHARLVERLLGLIGPGWRVNLEAPLPGRRSIDAQLESRRSVVLGEVESRVRRLEEIQRELHSKRDAAIERYGADRRVHVLLVLPPTHRHRALVREHGTQVAASFPARSSAIKAALADATLPYPGDGILWVPGSAEASSPSPGPTSTS
jgi:transcriptional regulator with XRE-family HTH domain